jgi:hypothetical protein
MWCLWWTDCVAFRPGCFRPFFDRPVSAITSRSLTVFRIVNWFAVPPHVKDGHVRDERTQAAYLSELIDLYAARGVHGCFVFTFVMRDFPHRPDSRHALDMAGGSSAQGGVSSRVMRVVAGLAASTALLVRQLVVPFLLPPVPGQHAPQLRHAVSLILRGCQLNGFAPLFRRRP